MAEKSTGMMSEKLMILSLSVLKQINTALDTLDSEGPLLVCFAVVFPYRGGQVISMSAIMLFEKYIPSYGTWLVQVAWWCYLLFRFRLFFTLNFIFNK